VLRQCATRTLINLDIDEPLTLLIDKLPERLQAPWLGSLELNSNGETLEWIRPKQGLLGEDGTLILVIRTVAPWDNFDGILDSEGGQIVDRHGILFVGGLAFVEGVHLGLDLGERDPVYQIEQTCLALAGKEFDRNAPGIDDYIIEQVARRQAREETRLRVKARAKAILIAHLNESQQQEFEANNEFHVRGADGYRYLITDKSQHNVFRVEGGRRTMEYCIVSRGFLPSNDQMLSQLLLLQAAPEMFHKITNTWELTEDGQRVLIPKEAPEEVDLPEPYELEPVLFEQLVRPAD
jgi:hypothetical protein